MNPEDNLSHAIIQNIRIMRTKAESPMQRFLLDWLEANVDDISSAVLSDNNSDHVSEDAEWEEINQGENNHE
jgi:hypothetical protein